MKPRTTRYFLIVLLAATLLPCPLWHGRCAAAEKKASVWQQPETLTHRFCADWNAMCTVDRELAGVADVLTDLRDLELFPAEITGFDKTALVRFDRRIEHLEKERGQLLVLLDELKPPLLDAMGILREMVVRKPVEPMFAILDQGNRKRSAELQKLFSRVGTLWNGIDTLLASATTSAGMRHETQEVKAGQTEFAGNYCRQTDALLDSLANRGPKPSVKEMFSIENHLVKRYLKENEVLRAQRKIAAVAARYQGKTDLGDLALSGARTALLLRNYGKALQASATLPDTGARGTLKLLYRMQSLYGSGSHDTLWQESEQLDFSRISGAPRNMLLRLAMESGLALHKKNSFVRLASFVDRRAPYALHVMHALGRSYLAAGDPSTALSIFESAAKFPVRSAADEPAAREIRYTVAETNYELGRYEKALRLFAELANDPTGFERGLYGMLWCYLQLGRNDKAENAMRTLINQSPDSRYAADAFLVLGKRFLYKAQYEWKKIVYLTNEEQRLQGLLERLEDKRKIDTAGSRNAAFAQAKNELLGLLSRLSSEPRGTYGTVAGCYDKAARINRLINDYYATGSFQKVVFTEKRELVLHELDSLMREAQAPGRSSVDTAGAAIGRGADTAINATVTQASIFDMETMIERARFEQEYLNWMKSRIKYAEQESLRPLLRNNDNASRAAIAACKERSTRAVDSLLAVEEKTRHTWYGRLTGRLQTLLARGIDSTNAAYFHYHLGELYYADENFRYAHDYDNYEKLKTGFEQKMAAYREGRVAELPAEPAPPHTDHARSMAEFSQALLLAPSSATAASAHYSLAWCWNDIAAFDSALSHMETVATQFPQSSFAPQAWMYAGEYLFDKGNLAEAIKCYQAVMKYPESEWFDEALYKLAWSQYRLSNPEKAISSFLALVDLGGGGKSAKTLLEKESMDYIAISFSESDLTGEKGLERATLFAKKLGDPERGSQILQRLAKVYRDQGRYELAKKTYRTLLRINPYYRNTPAVESELLAAMERDATPDEANRLKIDFFRKYNSTSEWAAAQPERDAVVGADSLAEKQLYEGAIGYHQMALQKNDTAAYGRALEVYTDFIRAYPKSNRASECHYNLAEIEFSLGRYGKATEEYITVSKRYPDSKFRETAAWNAIVASQNLLKKEGGNK
jgi:tetratricopeptide (TPR) repeat protein